MCDTNGESNPRTLYVGNLDNSVTEELVCTLFSHIGPILACKVIREPGLDPYAFIEFANHQAAVTAMGAMNHRQFLSKEMKVNWASSSGNQPRTDISNHHHIFVGDLSPEIEADTLKEAFQAFGEISNCRIVRDAQTLQSKGYAFLSFVSKEAAENAINSMNGQWLGNRSIRTNWSTHKPPPLRSTTGRNPHPPNRSLSYDEIYNQTGPTNCTVYCGGMAKGMSEEIMENLFSQFGKIVLVRAFKDKGYAFVKFSNKDSATRAIEAVNNTEVNGQLLKCFWGKEAGDGSNNQQNGNSPQHGGGPGPGGPGPGGPGPYPYGGFNPMPPQYWYPPNGQYFPPPMPPGFGFPPMGYPPYPGDGNPGNWSAQDNGERD